MPDCIFCDWNAIKEDVLSETEHFFVKVGLGIITAGHVMIVTKSHHPCLAELPSALEPEFSLLKEKVRKKVTQHFAEPFVVEYGLWGQSIPHAHLHFIPLQGNGYKLTSIIQELGKPTGIPFREGGFALMRQLYQKNGGYVALGEKRSFYIFDIASVKKQQNCLCYRPFFAKKGIGSGSWKNLSAVEKKADEEKRALTKKLLVF